MNYVILRGRLAGFPCKLIGCLPPTLINQAFLNEFGLP